MIALAGIVGLEIPAINSIPTPPASALLELPPRARPPQRAT